MIPFNQLERMDCSAKTVLITGANSGLGFEAARFLTERGAHVIFCARSLEKGQNAISRILQDVQNAKLSLERLDLADSASIDAFAKRVRHNYPPIDILLNNAGIMAVPYALTKDGFESQIGTNHLGHFRLTARLLDRLSPDARIVNVASNAHRQGKIDFDNFMYEHGKYTPFSAYARSKLSNLLFTQYLGANLKRSGSSITVVSAHPGVARTGLFDRKNDPKIIQFLIKTFIGLVPDAKAGARPLIMAALDPRAENGSYYGPGKAGEVHLDQPIPITFDTSVQSKLWTLSEQLTGVTYPFKS